VDRIDIKDLWWDQIPFAKGGQGQIYRAQLKAQLSDLLTTRENKYLLKIPKIGQYI